MPRVKDNAPETAEPEHGFAALEAKVEELQAEAAVEAGMAAEGAAPAAAAMRPELGAAMPEAVASPVSAAAERPPLSSSGLPMADAPALLKSTLGALTDCAQSALNLQAATLASFARVRSPQDLVAAQVEYGSRALELYLSSIARLTRAVPAFAV